MNISANYIYITFILAVLLFIYYYENKSTIVSEEIYSGTVVNTGDKSYYLDSESLYKHTVGLYEKILQLSVNFDDDKYNLISNTYRLVLLDLYNFIDKNGYSDFISKSENEIRYDLYTNPDKANFSFMELIIKFKLVIEIIKTNNSVGKLRLNSIYSLIAQLERLQKSFYDIKEIKPLEYTPLDMDNDETTQDVFDKYGIPNKMKSSWSRCNNATQSQSINSGYDIFDHGEEFINESESIVRNVNNKIGRCTTLQTHDLQHISDKILHRKQKCVTSSSTNEVDKYRSAREKIRSATVDLNAKKSLMNDYDYLDL